MVMAVFVPGRSSTSPSPALGAPGRPPPAPPVWSRAIWGGGGLAQDPRGGLITSTFDLTPGSRSLRRGARGISFRDQFLGQRQQMPSVLDVVFQRIEAADQERGDAEVVIIAQSLGDLFGCADQTGCVTARTRR